MTFAEHTKFRTTKVWKEFRKKLIAERGPCCELCGTKYIGKRIKQLQVHHKDPANYLDLAPEKFALCCNGCHDLIERISTKLIGKNSSNIPNLEKWVNLLADFLSLEALNALEEKHSDCLSRQVQINKKNLRGTN